MAAISKNVYTDELDDKWIIVNEYNNTYHTIKMKPVDVAYIFSSKDPKFNNGDNVRISKHKRFLLKDTLQIGLKFLELVKKLKTQFHGHMLLIISLVKKIIETFYEKELQKTNQ